MTETPEWPAAAPTAPPAPTPAADPTYTATGAQPGWGAHSADRTASGPGGSLLAGVDMRAVSPLDWAAIAAGFLTFVFTMVSGYYTASVSFHLAGVSGGSSATASVSAWHSPPFGWMAGLIALAAAAVIALDLFTTITLPFPARLASLGGFAVAFLFTLLALFVHPGSGAGTEGLGSVSVHIGHGFAYWICLILTIAGTAVSYVRFTQSGGKIPGISR